MLPNNTKVALSFVFIFEKYFGVIILTVFYKPRGTILGNKKFSQNGSVQQQILRDSSLNLLKKKLNFRPFGMNQWLNILNPAGPVRVTKILKDLLDFAKYGHIPQQHQNKIALSLIICSK